MKDYPNTPCYRPQRPSLEVEKINYTAEQINALLALVPLKADRKDINKLISFTADNFIGHYPDASMLADQDTFAWAFVGDLAAAVPYFHYTAGSAPEGYTPGWNNMQHIFGTYPLFTDNREDQLTAEELFKIPFRLPELTAHRAIADEHGNRIPDTYVTRQGLTEHIKDTYNQQFLENPPLITEGYITPGMLSEETRQMLEATGQKITNLPDGEDLQAVHGVLKFANKEYNPNSYDGLGRQYIRRNVVNGVNTLVQSMIQWSNTLYIIRYDHDLQGRTITIPEGCTLMFESGKFYNGTIILNNTQVRPYGCSIQDYIDCRIEGTYRKGQVLYSEEYKQTVVWTGEKWKCSYSVLFRTYENRLQQSLDDGETWENVSDYIASYFRFVASSSDPNSIGKIQISQDNKNWKDLSPEFTNHLKIADYVATSAQLPSSPALGTIYGVGPDAQSMYQIYVYTSKGWVNNGSFTSVMPEVVQETGDSETKVMSQKAVTEKLSDIGSKVGSKLLLESEKSHLLKTFNSREEARASVPLNSRKPNLEISYIVDGKIIKERYQSNDISKWENENYKGNWVDDLGRIDNAEQEIANVNILNVSDNFPLESGSYYTIETAIAAVPIKYRKYGLIIQFYDGNKWNYLMYNIKNYNEASWKNTKHWATLYEPNQHLIGSVFKSGQSLLVPFNLPIIDIFVISNPNNKRIFLNTWVKNDTHFVVQFCDEEGSLISQYRNTAQSTYPNGYVELTTSPLSESGVVLGVVVNADDFQTVAISEYNYWKPIEIVYKSNPMRNIQNDNALNKKAVSVFDVTSAIPLPSGEYYTFETAIAAVPNEYRKMGLVVQYYDGKKWNYVQFNHSNWVNLWTLKTNWSLYYTPNSHLIGSVFQPNVNLLIPGIDLIPVIDIFTLKNDNNKRIFLKGITNYANNRFTIQFVDEEKNLLCQYTTTSNFPKGLQKIRCGELYESGVIVDIVINGDLTNAYGTYSDLGYDLEIIQKKDEVADLQSKITALETLTSSLIGTNIVCFGDSITEFTNSSKKGYVEYIQEFTGANVVRGGIGGTRYAQRTTPALTPSNNIEAYGALDMVNLVKAWTSGDWSYVDAANQYLITNASDDNTTIINNLKNNPISSVNVVTMFAGTNDLTGGSAIGELNSSSNSEICGAINNIIKMILEANPNIRIFVFTPIVRYVGDERTNEKWSDNWKGTKGSTTTLAELSEIITNCAKQWHIPVCDMYWGLGWNQYNFSNYFVDTDNTHPVKGYDTIARKMVGFITSNRNF